MREILFRAWNKITEKMYEVEAVYPKSREIAVIYEDGNINILQDEKYELMQYVGLEDKNGVKIFEGDIVKAYKYGDKEKDHFEYLITFRVGCFWFGDWNWIEFLNKFRYIEVIGNARDGYIPTS